MLISHGYKRFIGLAFMACWLSVSWAQQATSELAPGYLPLTFTPPQPGSYQLPQLGQAGDGRVLDSDNQPYQLHDLLGDKVVILSFIYTTCSDVNGCPLATAVLHKLKSRLQREVGLSEHLRLLTLSFNPQHDTPAAMQAYGQELQGSGVDWRFLTTASDADLQPLLRAYPQNIQKVYNANGEFSGSFAHNLRVYLIDQHKQVRNIYNTTFLHTDTLINDVKTLLLPAHATTAPAAVASNQRLQPGDNKTDYDQPDYQTHSLALTARQGEALDLWRSVQQPQLGLPALPTPADNPLTPAKISLGRKLFYDRRLSFNNTFSCALCHIPEQGFSNNEMATSVGVEGRSVRRNAPTLYNIAYAQRLFHDARETSLEQQVWGPLLAPNEMANVSIGAVLEKLQRNAEYSALFTEAFAKPPSMETVGMALASYERVLNSGDAAFDRWYYAKQSDALSAEAQRGFALFTGKAGCAQCHSVNADYALFSDQQLHNTGIGYQASMLKAPAQRKVQVAPGMFVQVEERSLHSVAASKTNDLGYYEVSQNPADRWKYKTPTLRNISLSAPYMHNGSLATLAEVVAFYNQGGIAHENLDPLLKPLHLSTQEQADLVAFLHSLTGSNSAQLVADGFAAPIGD